MKSSFLTKLALLMALSPFLSSVQAQTPETGARPAITVAYDNGGELYLTDFNGPPVNLTNSPTYEMVPVWSPDGSQIAFLSSESYREWNKSHLNVMTLATGKIRSLSDLILSSETEMAWSPDGRLIAVAQGALFTVDTQTGMTQQIANYGHSPSWSLDSAHVLFQATAGIYLIDPDGRNLQRVVGYPIANNSPSFSPTEAEFLFLSNTEQGRVRVISRVSMDDMAITNLRVMPETYDAYWSPDGQQIAFVGTRAHGSEVLTAGLDDVYVMTRDGADLRSVTGQSPDAFNDEFRGWLPDSQHILYWAADLDGAGGSFHMVNITDGSQTLVSDAATDELCSYGNCRNMTVRPTASP